MSAGEVARALQRERFRQGLSVRDVSIRTGIPVGQLRASETGALHFHDQLAALKTVRLYADFLGLPGDRYALALLEQWPTRAASAWRSQLVETTQPPQGGNGELGGPPSTSSLPDQGGATAEIGLAAVAAVAPRPAEPETAAYAFCDTGVAPAVPAPYTSMVRRPSRRRPPVLLKVLVGVVAVAVVAALAALAVDRVKPSWLRSLGASPARTSAAPPAHTTTHTPPAHAASGHTGQAPSGALRPATTSSGSAVYHVGASPFTLSVSASGGRCWAEVTSVGAKTPLFAGILGPGQSKSFTIQRSATVNLGSIAGRISVKAGSHHALSTAEPPAAPYRITLTSSH